MHFIEFERNILTSNKNSPIYMFYGEEDFFKNRGVELIKGKCDINSDNIIRLSTTDADIIKISDELYTAPFMGGKKFVVLVIDTSRWKKADEDGLESSIIFDWLKEQYIKAPSPSSVLVILSEKAITNVNKSVVMVECTALSDYNLRDWIASLVTSRGKKIEQDALSELCIRHSSKNRDRDDKTNELSLLNSDIEKICTSLGDRDCIALTDVEIFSGKDIDYNNFMLVDAIRDGNISKAISVIHSRIREGESGEAMIGAITWGYKQMVEAKVLLEKGLSKYDMASALHLSQNIDINKFTSIIAKYSILELKDKFSYIVEADLMLKTSGESDSIILELLVYKLVSSPLVSEI